MKRFCLAALVFLLPATVFAQATSGSRLAWDQANADAASAQAYVYTLYADGGSGIVLADVTCSGSPVVCSAPFPAFTPGEHAIELTARNSAGESPRSAPLPFTFVVVPTAPATVRIQ
jgi:hypothetical protein